MVNIIELWNKIVFNISWTFMSPEKRYVYLWNRTKNRV